MDNYIFIFCIPSGFGFFYPAVLSRSDSVYGCKFTGGRKLFIHVLLHDRLCETRALRSGQVCVLNSLVLDSNEYSRLESGSSVDSTSALLAKDYTRISF